MSDKRNDFKFKYRKLSNDLVEYHIIYDHLTQTVTMIEKLINGEVKLKVLNDENDDSVNELYIKELQGMLQDITKNVCKK